MEQHLADLIRQAERDTAYTRSALVEQMRWLARNMVDAADRLEAGHGINSLGEVQGRGGAIDNLCGKLTCELATVGALKYAAELTGGQA